MNKPLFFFFLIVFLSQGLPITNTYSYSSVIICGGADCWPAYTESPGGTSGGPTAGVPEQFVPLAEYLKGVMSGIYVAIAAAIIGIGIFIYYKKRKPGK